MRGTMKPGVARTDHRHLADAFEQGLDLSDNRRIRRGPRRDFDQRDQIGRIEPVHVEEALGMLDRAGEIIDEDRRGRGGNDRIALHLLRCRSQHLALEIDDFGDTLEHHAGLSQAAPLDRSGRPTHAR